MAEIHLSIQKVTEANLCEAIEMTILWLIGSAKQRGLIGKQPHLINLYLCVKHSIVADYKKWNAYWQKYRSSMTRPEIHQPININAVILISDIL